MRVLVLGGAALLAGCGGGGTTGTNYSDPPPMAEIVATPSPKPSETPVAEPEAVAVNVADAAIGNDAAGDADEAMTANAM